MTLLLHWLTQLSYFLFFCWGEIPGAVILPIIYRIFCPLYTFLFFFMQNAIIFSISDKMDRALTLAFFDVTGYLISSPSQLMLMLLTLTASVLKHPSYETHDQVETPQDPSPDFRDSWVLEYHIPSTPSSSFEATNPVCATVGMNPLASLHEIRMATCRGCFSSQSWRLGVYV